MTRKLALFGLSLLLMLVYERCKTFAGASPSASVWSSISGDANFSTFRDLLQSTGLAEQLADRNASYTVFAPTNDAFNKLGAARLTELKSPEKKEELMGVVKRHIFAGTLDKESLVTAGKTPASLAGTEYAVKRINNRWFIGNARPTQNPLFAKNGIFYVVDSVLE